MKKELNGIGTNATKKVSKIMAKLSIPQDYKSELNLYDTQVAIKTVKDFFQTLLAERLHLLRVSAPLVVDPLSGMNDNLNGKKNKLSKNIRRMDDKASNVANRKLDEIINMGRELKREKLIEYEIFLIEK